MKYPANIYLFKFIKTLESVKFPFSRVCIVDFEYVFVCWVKPKRNAPDM